MRKCEKHSEYKGIRCPRYECPECLEIYYAVCQWEKEAVMLSAFDPRDRNREPHPIESMRSDLV